MDIKLEPLERTDFPRIRNWIDPEIFHIFKEPIDDGQLEMLLSKSLVGIPTEVGRRAIDQNKGEMVGLIHAVLDLKDDMMHIQQIVVNPKLRGQGYGSAILGNFIVECFAQFDLHRVQLFTEENNKSAIACYRKVGFKVDGIIRDRVKTKEGYLSTYIFSILSNEWNSE